MEKMYQTYKDIADFRLVYIKEAHASDSSWSVPYAKELNITEHKTYGQRCTTAEKLMKDKSLTIPTLVDNMEDSVSKAYKAHPDRIYVVRKDGRLAVAGKRGPFGFKPALNKAKEWLASYKETGEEPELVIPKSEKVDTTTDAGGAKAGHAVGASSTDAVVGSWTMTTKFNGNDIPAVMVIRVKDGVLSGTWTSQGMDMEMKDLKLSGNKLSFQRSMGGGSSLDFKGTVEGDKVDGSYSGPMGDLKCTGKRTR